ncbi:MAG: hypothetical protein BMS9Abin02_1534 [Anaerolineae bacterium]|nr:MAG: hypothetical protein BMS9Abin02_1534 [Anaerolineae bacterium]
MAISLKRPSWTIGIIALLLIFPAAVYLPGVSGPYVFDDYPNLLHNDFVKVRTLDTESLYRAAYSLEAGPLQRPVAMLSFALNYYFAGSFKDSAPFKLTNLAIHIINGLLIFWMIRIILGRLRRIHPNSFFIDKSSRDTLTWLAFALALLWVVHPIQLTSVLYLVQRMTALSALFTLLGLICYLKGRQRMISGQSGGVWLLISGLAVFGSLGVLSKENALLLPVFMLVLEFILFSNEWPWRSWRQLPDSKKRLLVGIVIVIAIVGLLWAINYALPGYGTRNFTMLERVLTEPRVLFFYLSLILVPRIDQFGLQHDDISLSTSFLTPWNTLPSIVGLSALFIIGIISGRKRPLLSLGILWFFAAHLLESTFISLEIAHEHRNYLASIGVFLVILHFLDWGSSRLGYKKLWWVLPLLALFYGGTTYLRAYQWSSYTSLYTYEALHHPNSAIAQLGVGIMLSEYGRYEEAGKAFRRAAELEPTEPSHLMWLSLNTARQGKVPDPAQQAKILKVLSSKPLTATTVKTLEYVEGCIQTWCAALQVPMEAWLRTILRRDKASDDKSYYYYYLGLNLASQGRMDEAIESLRLAYQFDPAYLHPLFKLASIYVKSGRINDAERILSELRKANKGNLNPRDREIGAVAADIDKLKKRIQHMGLKKSEAGQ